MTLPRSSTRLQDESGGLAVGSDLCCVLSPCVSNADGVPRLYPNTQDMYDAHGYCQGLDYAALHMQETGKPVLFVPLAIGSAGSVGRFDASGNTGTCVVTCAGGSNGVLEETDGILKVVTGGTIGTDNIVLSLSCDGGRKYVEVKLGTDNSYTIPYVGLVLSFAAGTLVANDTALTWHSVAPLADSAAITAARALMAAQSKLCLSWLYTDTLSTGSDANMAAIKAAIDAYDTSNDRYELVKCMLRDALPQATMSQTRNYMTGSPSITFHEVGATGDTITRSAGSFTSDGMVTGDTIVVTGAVTGGGANNVTCVPASFAALVLTLDSDDLVDEGPISGVSIYATPTLTFSTGAKTITRNRGSWLADGFRVGDTITVADTVSNDGDYTVTVATALVLTVSESLSDETIGSYGVSITAGETDSACGAALDASFATITGDEKIDLGYGRGAMLSPITGWRLRRNVNWADSLLRYKRDMRTATWWVDLGPISERLGCGFDLTNAAGVPVEHDERVTTCADAAGFTYARTWSNGKPGAYIGKSQTRKGAASLLSHTHFALISNLARTVCEAAQVMFVGQTIIVTPPDAQGRKFATAASRKLFESKVNNEVARYLLSNIGGEGPRASSARWSMAADDDFAVASPVVHGTLQLVHNGIVVSIETVVAVQ